MHEAAGRNHEALRHRTELLRIEGGHESDYLKLAAQLEAAGLSDERRLTLERGFFKHPGSPRLAVALGGALHQAKKLKEATAIYEEAVLLASKHDPDALDDAYYLARAELAHDCGEMAAAAIYFRKAIDKAPAGKPARAVPAYAGLATLWLEEGVKIEEARELLRLAESLKKDDPSVTRALALYGEKKKIRDAEQTVKQSP
jgi:tetratricopeptide (TPR) repeat protein